MAFSPILLKLIALTFKGFSILTKLILWKSLKFQAIFKLYGVLHWLPQLIQLMVMDSQPIFFIAVFETLWLDLTNLIWALEERALLQDIQKHHPNIEGPELQALKDHASQVSLEKAVVNSTKLTLGGIGLVFGYILFLCVFGEV